MDKLSYIVRTAKFISSATSHKYPFLEVITHFEYLLRVANTHLW